VVKAAEGGGLAVHQVRLGAHAVKDACELDRDVAASQDDDLLLGELLQRERMVRSDAVLLWAQMNKRDSGNAHSHTGLAVLPPQICMCPCI
jgi:hypothetical protein